MKIKKVCVFCGSSIGNSEKYAEEAEKLGKGIADSSVELIYGGGDVGLMGILSRAVMENGGRVTGVIPEKLYRKVPHSEISEIRVVKDMHERKALMYSLSDAYICLPGGIGSLEELTESFTWLQLGYHSKPICIVNTGGYYSGLINQFEIMVREGFLKKSHMDNLLVSSEVENILEDLEAMKISFSDKWEQEVTGDSN